MDFEFNQSSTVSSNGITPVRTQGGTNPTLWLSTWETADKNKCESASKVPCWGAKQNLTAAGTATGSINTSAIPSGSSDGLGSISPRTFGEATINFSRQVPPGTCTSFGSAYLKSRSSDSFTSALKDFIDPMSVSISNCGGVKIVKTDDAGNPLAGAEFTLYKNAAPTTAPRGAEDVITSPVKKCTTDAQGVCTMTGVLIGDYWAVESVVPAGHIGSADVAVSVTGEQTVTVNVVNQRQRGAIEIVKTAKHFDATSAPNLQATFTISRGGTAVAGADQVSTGWPAGARRAYRRRREMPRGTPVRRALGASGVRRCRRRPDGRGRAGPGGGPSAAGASGLLVRAGRRPPRRPPDAGARLGHARRGARPRPRRHRRARRLDQAGWRARVPAGARGASLGAGDLLTLGSHVEVTEGATFLHLFWRVRRSGLGRFDIELNRSVLGSSAPGRGGPVRRPGDVLISLDLSARVPAVGLFQWEGADRSRCAAFRAVPCWSRRSTLSRAGGVLAAVAFNDAPIAAAASDGLGPLPERTFAEASFDLSAFEPPGACFSFGSVTVTSRASGPFAREARDLIGPLPTLISTCAAGTPRPLQFAPS